MLKRLSWIACAVLFAAPAIAAEPIEKVGTIEGITEYRLANGFRVLLFPDNSKATVTVTIDASSIETGVADRDGHLKSPDFFDVAQYPELRFVGKRVQARSGDEIDVIGDLTIKGVTREVVLRVEQHGQATDPWGNVRAAFTATTTIDRKDFGLTWNQALETGGVLVGDRVEIEAEIEAVKQAAALVA